MQTNDFMEWFVNIGIIFLLVSILPILYMMFVFCSFIISKFFKTETETQIIYQPTTEIEIEILPKYEIYEVPPPAYVQNK
jgi:hypothetical protein